MSTVTVLHRRALPGAGQVACRAGVVLGVLTAIGAAEAAGSRPPGWVLGLLVGLALWVAARPESAAGAVMLVGAAYVWFIVPDQLSPLVLVAAAGMVLAHVAALVAAQGPSTMRVDAAQCWRWLRRGILLGLTAAVVWRLDLAAEDLPSGRLTYAAGLTLLTLLAATTAWVLGPRR